MRTSEYIHSIKFCSTADIEALKKHYESKLTKALPMKRHAKCGTGGEYRADTDMIQIEIQTDQPDLPVLKRVTGSGVHGRHLLPLTSLTTSFVTSLTPGTLTPPHVDISADAVCDETLSRGESPFRNPVAKLHLLFSDSHEE